MELIKEVGTFEAKRHFSRLLDEVQTGTRIVVTRHGKPVAEIRAPGIGRKPALFGSAKSPDFYKSEDFDAPLNDFKEYRLIDCR